MTKFTERNVIKLILNSGRDSRKGTTVVIHNRIQLPHDRIRELQIKSEIETISWKRETEGVLTLERSLPFIQKNNKIELKNIEKKKKCFYTRFLGS